MDNANATWLMRLITDQWDQSEYILSQITDPETLEVAKKLVELRQFNDKMNSFLLNNYVGWAVDQWPVVQDGLMGTNDFVASFTKIFPGVEIPYDVSQPYIVRTQAGELIRQTYRELSDSNNWAPVELTT